MTALEVIRDVDGKMHNVYTQQQKLDWLSRAEGMVLELLARSGEKTEAAQITADTALSAPAPYDALYGRWLEAQIHYASQEYMKFNNAMALFSSLWQAYSNFVRRGAAPVGRRRFF